MGSRERRYVPSNWEHPKDAAGEYTALMYDYDADNAHYQEGVDFQKVWKHRVPKQHDITEPRINLTFRYIHSK